MAEAEEQKAVNEDSNGEDKDDTLRKSMMDAVNAYRKIKEGKKELTEKEQIILDEQCKNN